MRGEVSTLYRHSPFVGILTELRQIDIRQKSGRTPYVSMHAFWVVPFRHGQLTLRCRRDSIAVMNG